jgi:hypothetical protein
MKTDRFEEIDTVKKLVDSLFPHKMDEVARSNKPKREASEEWLNWYINGKRDPKPQYEYKDIEAFAFGLWAKWHDDKDSFFKDRRDDLIELVSGWANCA